MFSRHSFIYTAILALILTIAVPAEAVGSGASTPQTSSTSKKKRSGSGSSKKKVSGNRQVSSAGSFTKSSKGGSTGRNSGKGNVSGKSAGKGKTGNKTTKNQSGNKGNVPAKKETAADVRKRQEETRREIQRTQEELKRNEAEMKKSLSDLGRINADLEKAKGEVSALQAAVGQLDGRITALSSQIADNEAKLAHMRSEYLKAVKKMRTARRNTSALAFIFSSENFNQAMRRMRYLRQFSSWKDKQSAEINKKVAQLGEQRKNLSAAKAKKDDALRRQQVASDELAKKGREQDAVVADLKRNGDLLTVHLSKKQQEANALKSRISALIAEEERKAAAERAAAEKRAAEKQEAERLAAEKRTAEKAAEQRRLAEQKERELALAETKKEEPAQAKTQPVKKEQLKKEQPAKETVKKKEQTPNKGEEGKDYASARKRKPRSDSKSPEPKAETSKPKVETPKNMADKSVSKNEVPKASDNGFASMKGSLPRPVDGSWRVTSRFGRQELPDLPGVVYDNPGINVEVNIGSTVKSIYSGKVSGVYMVPGYQTVVIINHGNYYTAYGNLKSPAVKVGDNVKAGQKLGNAGENLDDPGHGELHFEVYRNREKLNPLEWIR